MSTLTYAGIPLGDLRVLDYRADVLTEGEGKTYLGTRYTLSVRGTYNPRTVAWTQSLHNPPVAVVGTLAPTTEVALRHVLSQPRQALVYQVGSQEVLRSPPYVDPVAPVETFGGDIENGPWPVVRRIDTRHGAVKTFVVDFTVTTTLNECNRFYESPSALLSHRWQETHTLDQDYFETRVIQGRAIFRADRLRWLDAQADDYRAWLLNACPIDFKRAQLEVRQSDDGRILEYQITDRMRPLNISRHGWAANVTRIEAYEIQTVGQAGLEDTALNTAGIFVGGLDSFMDIVSVARKALPTTTVTVVVRVWGNRYSNRQQLAWAAITVAKARKELTAAWKIATSVDGQMTYDLAGKFVELRCKMSRGPFTSTFGGFWNIPPAPANDSSAPILKAGHEANRGPPNDGGSRGDYLKHMVPAALQAPCQVPARPPNPDNMTFASREPP